MKTNLSRLYLIIDVDVCGKEQVASIARETNQAGINMFQIRWKNAPDDRSFLEVTSLLLRSIKDDALVIVNDRADIALCAGAHGVHVGENDLPPENLRKAFGERLLIGYSCHSIEEIENPKIYTWCDYLAFGSIYPTKTKKSPVKVQGTDMLKKAVAASRKPLYAIGGINTSNVKNVLETGVFGIACISAILDAKDPAQAADELLKQIKSHAAG